MRPCLPKTSHAQRNGPRPAKIKKISNPKNHVEAAIAGRSGGHGGHGGHLHCHGGHDHGCDRRQSLGPENIIINHHAQVTLLSSSTPDRSMVSRLAPVTDLSNKRLIEGTSRDTGGETRRCHTNVSTANRQSSKRLTSFEFEPSRPRPIDSRQSVSLYFGIETPSRAERLSVQIACLSSIESKGFAISITHVRVIVASSPDRRHVVTVTSMTHACPARGETSEWTFDNVSMRRFINVP